MYIEDCKQEECIKNLTATKYNNEIQIRWDWPELTTGIDYVYIFEVKDENETLEELEKRNARQFSFSRKNYTENGCYRRTIPSDMVRYRIFPIKINHANTIVLNQNNNTTKIFYKSIIIEYSLITKSKKIYFKFANPDAFTNIADHEIVYHKYDRNNEYICTYPLNVDLIAKQNYSISVNKGEQIKLDLKDNENDIVKFRLK